MLRTVLKHYPFWKGRGVLANSQLLRSKTKNNRVVKLNHGLDIVVTENDYISRMIRFFGDFDPSLTKLLFSILRPGDILIDIGANLGVITLPAAKLVGSTGLVWAFEPQQVVRELLIESIKLNSLSNVTVYSIALSNFDGSGRVFGDKKSLGSAKLSEENSAFDNDSCIVKPLDSLTLDTAGHPVRVIKIDVEGHEAEVLEGASKFLSEYTPQYVLFESHPSRGAFEEREEIKVLRRFQYQILSVRKSIFLRPLLKDVRLDRDSEYSCSEFLAKKSHV